MTDPNEEYLDDLEDEFQVQQHIKRVSDQMKEEGSG